MSSSESLDRQATSASPGKHLATFTTLTLLIILAGGLLPLASAWRNLEALDTLLFPDDTDLLDLLAGPRILLR